MQPLLQDFSVLGQQKVTVIIAEHIINILEVREIRIDNSKLFRPGVQNLLGFFLESADQVNPGQSVAGCQIIQLFILDFKLQ